jgi:phage-related protein
MPTTTVRLFRDDDGTVPFLDWLSGLERRNRKVYEKCRSYLQRLADLGHELRRPTADLLRDGVYELRFAYLGVNYRILYGFVGKDIALVSHGITKEAEVPSREIDLARARLDKFRTDPEKYSAQE